jgi:DNA replication protein DnaC
MTGYWEVSPMVELEHARALLAAMGLETTAVFLDAQMERSQREQHTYSQFLNDLLTSEQQERDRKSEEMRLRLAHLPHRKGLDEFDFSFQPSIDKRQIDELGTLSFTARCENLVFLGPPGVGKTHLAVGLAMKALKAGLTVYYTSLARLIEDLKRSMEQGRLDKRWRIYLRPVILIIDEVGYCSLAGRKPNGSFDSSPNATSMAASFSPATSTSAIGVNCSAIRLSPRPCWTGCSTMPI